jgi:flagellar hook-basal body complex protein FliE
MNPISGINPLFTSGIQPQQLLVKPVNTPVTNGATPIAEPFDTTLHKLVGEVNKQQLHAGDLTSQLLNGRNVPLHQTMIAIEEASVSFQLMVEVRNKLMDSYQELMRMQI